MEKGKLIVVEGACDGIGKSTQFQLLLEHLKSDGMQVVNHHFPSYGTYQGKAVEMYLQGGYGQPDELSPYFINSLYANDRAITWLTELKSHFEKGEVVLLDRYTTSSLIYQSALIEDVEEKKRFIDYVCDFEYNKLGIQKPDKVIFLYAPFDLVTKMRMARKQNEGVCNDIHESNLEFMKKVYESAMFIADYLSWDKVLCNKGNEMRSIGDIHKEIYKLVKKKI
jgi:dTMP kinase